MVGLPPLIHFPGFAPPTEEEVIIIIILIIIITLIIFEKCTQLSVSFKLCEFILFSHVLSSRSLSYFHHVYCYHLNLDLQHLALHHLALHHVDLDHFVQLIEAAEEDRRPFGTQLFPFRTIAMILSMISLVLVSKGMVRKKMMPTEMNHVPKFVFRFGSSKVENSQRSRITSDAL